MWNICQEIKIKLLVPQNSSLLFQVPIQCMTLGLRATLCIHSEWPNKIKWHHSVAKWNMLRSSKTFQIPAVGSDRAQVQLVTSEVNLHTLPMGHFSAMTRQDLQPSRRLLDEGLAPHLLPILLQVDLWVSMWFVKLVTGQHLNTHTHTQTHIQVLSALFRMKK